MLRSLESGRLAAGDSVVVGCQFWSRVGETSESGAGGRYWVPALQHSKVSRQDRRRTCPILLREPVGQDDLVLCMLATAGHGLLVALPIVTNMEMT